MSINVPRPPQQQPQPSARLVAASVLGQIGAAVRRAQMVGAAHAATGCPLGGAGGGCVPCQAEARRSWAEYCAAERVEVARQHAESMARLARRPVSPRTARLARDAALTEATRRIGGAGARCVVCRVDHADGLRPCRSCGAEATDANLGPFLDTLNGRARADRSPEYGSSGGAGGAGGSQRRQTRTRR
jgi:hypothetical protein